MAEYKNKQPDDEDIEWENDPKTEVNIKVIMIRNFMNLNTKEEIFYGDMKRSSTG
jgi:hypothetical protein